MDPVQSEITELLKAWRGGDQSAFDRVTPLLYGELKKIARGYARFEREGATLQATALVNEAYLRLANVEADWIDRAHFLAVAARVMRRLLVDAARSRNCGKRMGRGPAIALDEVPNLSTTRSREMIAVDDALAALAEFDPRRAKVVELRFFGGLSVEETAAVLDISAQSVMRDWRLARSWIIRELAAVAGSATEPGSERAPR